MVMHDSDKYWVYNPDFKLPESIRQDGTPANMIEWSASTSSYTVFEHALKDVITETMMDNTDAPLNLEIDTTEYLVDKILLRQEYEASKLCFTTTTWGNNTTLTTANSFAYNTTTSAPIALVLSATSVIVANSGKRPNKIVMGWDVFKVARENPNIYNRIQYVERAIITENLLAALFDVDQVLVGSAIIDSTKEGIAASMGYVWGSDVLVGYFDPNPGLKKVTAAVNFRVAKKGTPFRVKKWFDEEIEGNYIEVQSKFKPKAVATSCAYLFKTAALV
jgi:hypothetical protein